MKKTIPVLFLLILLLTSLPLLSLYAHAENPEPGIEDPEDPVYFTDLFFGYSYAFLRSDGLFQTFQRDTDEVLDQVYEDYLDSPASGLAFFKETLLTAADLRQWIHYMLDATGLTSYTYNNALDKANEQFARQLLEYSSASNAAKTAGTAAKWAKNINKVAKTYDAIAALHNEDWDFDPTLHPEAVLNYYIDYFQLDYTYEYIDTITLDDVAAQLMPRIQDITAWFDNASDAFSAMKAISIALMIEEVRLETIHDIIQSTPADSIVHEGMVRLENQLRNGFVSYFMDTYVEKEVLKKIEKPLIDSITNWVFQSNVNVYKVFSALAKLGSFVVFDLIFDIPDLDEVTTLVVLRQYTTDLYLATVSKNNDFFKQFSAADVTQYESLCDGYFAAARAAMKASEKVVISADEDMLEAMEAQYEELGSFEDMVEDARAYMEAIPREERTRISFGTWTVSSGTVELYQPTEDNMIEDNVLYLVDGALDLDLLLNGAGLTVPEGVSATINGKMTVKKAQSFVIDGELTAADSIRVESTLTLTHGESTGEAKTIRSDITVDDPAALSIPQDACFTIDGNVLLSGYLWSDYNTARLINNGNLTITGSLSTNNNAEISNNGRLQVHDLTLKKHASMGTESDDAVLMVGGNYSSELETIIIYGNLIFNGTEQQTVQNLSVYNIEVQNPAGIKYLSPLHLYGTYKLNGNPLDCNGRVTYCHTGCSFGDDSDYGRLYVVDGNTLVLSYEFTADIAILSYGAIRIPEGTHAVIHGSIEIYTSSLSNYGDLTVDSLALAVGESNLTNYGFLQVNQISSHSKDAKINMSNDAVLAVSGNSDFSNVNYKNGKLLLNGSEQQTVQNLTAYTVEVQNPEGIRYLSNLSLYGEYKLNGNPLDCNGYCTYCYFGSSFGDESNYGSVFLMDNCFLTLSHDLSATYFYAMRYSSLRIPEEADVTIHCNVNISNASLFVNGTLTIDGDCSVDSYDSVVQNNGRLQVNSLISSHQNARILMSDDAVLSVSGDLELRYSDYTTNINGGTVVLNGTGQQTVKYLRTGTIVLENESEAGVVFATAVRASVLFDHRQNNFTLYANGSGSYFVDYDGDGMRDDVDPYPTVGNPCVITVLTEDAEKGTVAESLIETVGGTKVTVHAEPTFKYWFLAWKNASGSTLSTEADYAFVARGNQTLTAYFTKRTQPITAEASGGVIQAPELAEIESTVTISIFEDEGYAFQEGSLCRNGIAIEGLTFEMPDEPVLLTAIFDRNESYFALKQALEEAEAVPPEPYSSESYAALLVAIENGWTALNNHITEEESAARIAELDAAVAALAARIPVSLTAGEPPVLYVGLADAIRALTVTVRFDNGCTQTVEDWEIEGFDCDTLGEQTATIVWNDLETALTVTVVPRRMLDVIVTEIPDQVFPGDGSELRPEIEAVYPADGAVLVPGVDYTAVYSDNIGIGTASVVVTGLGRYDGVLTLNFTIWCRHQYETVPGTPPTCTEPGISDGLFCTICGEVAAEQTGLPALGHDYTSVVTYPTISESGFTTYTCTRCGDSYQDDVTSPLAFIDIPAGCYYETAVGWAVVNGVTTGINSLTFSPDSYCTRAQVVTFLWRTFGCPEPVGTDCPFIDVPSHMYYYKAVLWAQENQITSGTSETTFSPSRVCTRAQIVVFLWRAMGCPEPAAMESPYVDVSASSYYSEAVIWAAENGIAKGISSNLFSPYASCTRAQTVTFLWRCVTK